MDEVLGTHKVEQAAEYSITTGLVQDADQVAAHDLHVGGVDDAEAAFMLARCFPVALTYVIPRVPVRACRSAPRIPARLATSIAAPRMSTAWPSSRSAGARSTTVGEKPCLDSQYASVRPPPRAGNQYIPAPRPGPPGCPAGC